MASQVPAAPNPTDDNPQIKASEVVQPIIENQHDAKPETAKAISPTSVFVNTEPMREDQVQNAVKFLSHPKVRGSPVIYRRSFLERKGLTKEEIDEAFHRVPDPTPTISSAQPGGPSQDGQNKSSSNVLPQASSQALQPAAAAPAGTIAGVRTLTLTRFHWSHALLAVGLLAVSGAGTAVLFKNAVIPRLKSWIRKVVLEEDEEGKKISSKPSLAEEAAAAAKAAARAAADVAQVSQEMLVSKTEERIFFKELMNMLDVQVKEMKSLSNAIRKLEGHSNTRDAIPFSEQDHRVSGNSSRQPNANGKVDVDWHPVRSASPPAPVEPSPAPQPKSYMEIMAMIQRGERPPNIRDIDDQPPNPNQPLPNPSLAPRTKPWEVGQVGQVPNNASQFWSRESSDGFNSNSQGNGHSSQMNEDNVPWWQKKNVRITEMETEDEPKIGSSALQTNEPPIRHLWVPPQPPPVVMPEAAAAIRLPKKPPSEKQLMDDQSASNSSDITDELQRITKISESGGAVDVIEENSDLGSKLTDSGGMLNGGFSLSETNTSEIQVVQE